MDSEFYGATREAQSEVSKRLRLRASGFEQDWELEFADPTRVGDMIDLLSTEIMSLDVKCALSLLLIHSIEVSELDAIQTNQIARASEIIRSDKQLLERMKFFFIKLGQAESPDLIARILE